MWRENIHGDKYTGYLAATTDDELTYVIEFIWYDQCQMLGGIHENVTYFLLHMPQTFHHSS